MNLDRDLHFKGSRTYLHSTTVFDDLLTLRSPGVKSVDFKFDKRTDRQVRYQSQAPGDDQQRVVASWRDGDGVVYVVERDAAIIESRPYDEGGLARSFAFDGQRVSLPADVGGHSLIEALVAGFKVLLQRTVAGSGAKLAFVRLRLSRIPTLPVDIRFSRRIGEFYQGDITADGQPVGQIFFGEWT